jgi:hypothetical protein
MPGAEPEPCRGKIIGDKEDGEWVSDHGGLDPRVMCKRLRRGIPFSQRSAASSRLR